MLPIRVVLISLTMLSLASCVDSPPSRSPSESNLAVTLKGVTAAKGETIQIDVVDQNTGTRTPFTTATSIGPGMPFTTTTGKSYSVYPWSAKLGVLAKHFWSPQNSVDDLKVAQGHLEVFASVGGIPFSTFSAEAGDAAATSGLDPAASAGHYSDGTSTVLFDQTGVGMGAEGSWVPDRGMVSNPPTSGFSSVAWSVGHYTVENGAKTIYGLICTPTTPGTHPVVIFNHGGVQGAPGGNLTGDLTASGWTTQPAGFLPDSLGQCIDWAKRGWIFATSAYRGASVTITAPAGVFSGGGTWTSPNLIEFCMGEVTDVMALTDLVMNQAVGVGGAGQMTTLKPNGKLFMYGYSHGGCVTWRAVEQGAPVTAFSVIEGFSDLRLSYLTARNLGVDASDSANDSGAYQAPGVDIYQPDAKGVMGYNWRSAHYFATRGDLALYRFKSMPILILQGDVDFQAGPPPEFNPVPLAQATLISADIGATNIFVGPNNFTPAQTQPCVGGAPGAALTSGSMNTLLPGLNSTCPVVYTKMDTGDSCVNGAAVPIVMNTCAAITLPLAPAPGQPVQQHYLAVYHNMNHTNGGYAFKATFAGFVKTNFMLDPGCDGLQGDCATD